MPGRMDRQVERVLRRGAGYGELRNRKRLLPGTPPAGAAAPVSQRDRPSGLHVQPILFT